MAARSKLTARERRRIIELAAQVKSGAAISLELDGKVTRQAVNKFLAKPERAAAVKSEKNRLIRAEQERKRWERTRLKLAREAARAAREEARDETPIFGRRTRPEKLYASPLGPNARERAGLSAMPDESSRIFYPRLMQK